tara:strand:- start:63 stop:395 length:333 start_codon:yes stop_codon:yes gene_type:complete
LINKLIGSIGLIFFIFSLLQINDPDAFVWFIAYLIPSIFSLLTILNHKLKFLKSIGFTYLLLALFTSIYIDVPLTMFIFSEKTNESLGLLFCAIWIFILSKNNNLTLINN